MSTADFQSPFLVGLEPLIISLEVRMEKLELFCVVYFCAQYTHTYANSSKIYMLV